jgi:hypothetical protein
MKAEPPTHATLPKGVLAIRPGVGANCSSIGSVVDTLFAGAVVGGAIFAAVAAALAAAEKDSNDAGRAGPSGPPAPTSSAPEDPSADPSDP